MKKRQFGELFLVAVVISAAVFCVNAQSGSLDSTFDFDGIVTGIVNPGVSNYSHDVVIQQLSPTFEPKLVVAAYIAGDFCVLRYNSNGSIDTSFGIGGVSRVAITPATDSEEAYSLAIQADGKIVVAGRAFIEIRKNSSLQGFAVTRLLPDGALDTSFGNNGRLLFNFVSTLSATGAAVAVQSNGSIVVAGRSGDDFAVARLLPNGDFDPSFNGSGKTIIKIGKNISGLGASSVKIQADGKIVLGGTSNWDFAVIRLNINGSLDPIFGGTGIVITDFNGRTDKINQIAIDGVGNIVAVGWAWIDTSYKRFGIVRYQPNGQLDPSFNGTGKLVAGSPGSNELKGVMIDGFGRINAVGTRKNSGGPGNFAVLRLNPNGTFDTSFGGTGMVVTSITSNDSGEAIAIQPDGRLVVAGWGETLNLIVLARYLP